MGKGRRKRKEGSGKDEGWKEDRAAGRTNKKKRRKRKVGVKIWSEIRWKERSEEKRKKRWDGLSDEEVWLDDSYEAEWK